MDSQPALEAAKEVSTHLLYLGVGVFALVGGYLSSQPPKHGRKCLLISLALFGLSLLFGLGTLMRVVVLLDNLQDAADKVDVNDAALRSLACGQVGSVFVASIFFFAYLCFNLRRA